MTSTCALSSPASSPASSPPRHAKSACTTRMVAAAANAPPARSRPQGARKGPSSPGPDPGPDPGLRRLPVRRKRHRPTLWLPDHERDAPQGRKEAAVQWAGPQLLGGLGLPLQLHRRLRRTRMRVPRLPELAFVVPGAGSGVGQGAPQGLQVLRGRQLRRAGGLLRLRPNLRRRRLPHPALPRQQHRGVRRVGKVLDLEQAGQVRPEPHGRQAQRVLPPALGRLQN
mmetsp:Transcript_52211/g.119091  ORF Transcript_52211/g.119091 Transcript_52211/m.119091 type:complete len:226 (-) Transcript_52211:1074-1751(-)